MITNGSKIQEIARIPISEQEWSVDKIAAFIDSEIALERVGEDGSPINVDSVSIVDDETQFQFPYAHSGEEFRSFVRNLAKFNLMK